MRKKPVSEQDAGFQQAALPLKTQFQKRRETVFSPELRQSKESGSALP
jgi:hypothetical protein